MNHMLDNIYGLFFSPVQTLRNVAKRRLIGQGIVVYFISLLVSTMSRSNAALPTGISPELDEMIAELSAVLPSLMLLSALVISPIIYIVMVSIIHLVSDVFGGHGSAGGLLAAFGFTQLPQIIVAPFGLLYSLTGFDLTGFIGLIVLIWTLVLNIIAIRENYGFSTGRAILVYFIPYLALFVLAVIFFSVFFGLVGSIPGIVP